MPTRASTRRSLASLMVLGVFALGLTACGSASNSSSTSGSSTGSAPTTATITHTKAKFVLHAGLAFGAFHRWIYKPLKAGELQHPFTHKLATLKAAAASLFIYHELKLALADAQADPTLSHLVAPITALQNKIHGVGSTLKSGQVDTSGIQAAAGSIGSIRAQAAAAGQAITDQTPAAP